MTTAKEAREAVIEALLRGASPDYAKRILDAYAAAVERETEARWRERMEALAVMLVPADDEAEMFCGWRQMAYDQARAWVDGVEASAEEDR